jgi:hypothetical protein
MVSDPDMFGSWVPDVIFSKDGGGNVVAINWSCGRGEEVKRLEDGPKESGFASGFMEGDVFCVAG